MTRAVRMCAVCAVALSGAVTAAPASADPIAAWFATQPNKMELNIATDLAMQNVSVTMAPGTTIVGPVTPEGEGACQAFASNRFSCAYNPPRAPGTTAIVRLETAAPYVANDEDVFVHCEPPCASNGSNQRGPYAIAGPEPGGGGTVGGSSGAPGPDLAVNLDGPLFALPGQAVTYQLTVKNVGAATSVERKLEVTTAARTAADRETRFISGLCSLKGKCQLTVPALAKGIQKSFSLQTRPDLGTFDPGFAASLLILVGSTGDRTLVAELQGEDPKEGANDDQHVTTVTRGAPSNDSNARCPAPGARGSAAACSVRARALRALTGTASGDVARVEVALVRASGGARAARARCAWLAPNGKLRTMRRTRGRCLTPVWVPAKGTRRWRLRLRRKLPKGSYVLYSRAISRAGAPENRYSKRDRNRLALRLR